MNAALPDASSTASRNATSRGSTSCAASSRPFWRCSRPSISTPRLRCSDRPSSTRGTRRRSRSRTAASRSRSRARAPRPARGRRRCRASASRRRVRQNGTSAPRPSAISTGSGASTPSNTAAASAEPPPSPAPGGMPLCNSIATFAPASPRGAHREVRVVDRYAGGVWSGNRDRDVVGRSQHELVVRLAHRHDQRVELVVSVGPHTHDLERQGQLRVGREARHVHAATTSGPLSPVRRMVTFRAVGLRLARTCQRGPLLQ